MTKKKRVIVSLDDDVYIQLDEFSKKYGLSYSFVVSLCIKFCSLDVVSTLFPSKSIISK